MKPDEVRSPRRSWTLIEVLYDGGDGGDSLAVGEWDGERRLAARWNGATATDIGNPQSRGLPTWFILPPRYNAAVLSSFSGKELAAEKKKLAEALLREV